jgi:hypothetical protein
LSASVGRKGYLCARCSEANKPRRELPSVESSSLVSVSVEAVDVDPDAADVRENDGWVRQATSPGWRVDDWGSERREARAERVGVGGMEGARGERGRGRLASSETGVVLRARRNRGDERDRAIWRSSGSGSDDGLKKGMMYTLYGEV